MKDGSAIDAPADSPLPADHRGARQGGARPNVVMVVFDDLGFADFGCYGSAISTPTVDRLAANGLRYNNFHVTSMCSPTRACMLTGRNHHAVGMGSVANFSDQHPGYTGRIPLSTPTLPRALRAQGYNTFAVGKWHLSPPATNNAAGPFDRWPLGMGFERYYGFLDGATNQWTPRLVRDNSIVAQPRQPDQGYHLSEDLAAQAVRLIQDQKQDAPEKPFFLYFALGAPHSPHQVWPEWVEPYEGRFDDGWEAARERSFRRQLELGVVPERTKLTERPEWVQSWAALSPRERRWCARQMEVYAGFVSHADAQLGRLIEFLETVGVLDETIVIVTSDNGASAEGGPLGEFSVGDRGSAGGGSSARADRRLRDLGGFRASNHYSWGWAWAGNTPFRLWKRYAWLGGVRVPLVLHWPSRVAPEERNQVRGQFCHAVDLMPSLLDATDAGPGLAEDLDGKSLLPTLESAASPAPRDTQYFEMLGSRAIYHRGWKATTNHVSSFLASERELLVGSREFGEDAWSLFNLDEDFSEASDLGAEHPERLREMVNLWWHEAGRNQVLPLIDTPAEARVPATPAERRRWFAGGGPISPPPVTDGFRMTASIEVEDEPVEGVICAHGDWTGGWVCYVLDGKPVATVQTGGEPVRVSGAERLEAGLHEVELECLPGSDTELSVRLSVDGAEAGAGRVPAGQWRWVALSLGMYGPLFVGRDEGFPVCEHYRPPFELSARIVEVGFETPGQSRPGSPEARVEEALRHD